MSNADSKHWTNDQDLLERFVLGDLGKETQRQLDRHLADCVECREAVRREREIAAGIRRFGREQMKARLKKAVDASHREVRHSLSWQKMASIAAVLVVVIGIGYYGRIFKVLEGDQIASHEQADKKDLAAESQARKEEKPQLEVTPETRLEPDSKMSAGSELAGKKEAEAYSPDKREKSISLALKESKGESTKDAAVSAAPAGMAEVSEAKKTSGGLSTSSSVKDEAGIWTEGRILEDPLLSKGPLPGGKFDRAAVQSQGFANQATQTKELEGLSKTKGNQKWTVTQRPSDLLPVSRQQLYRDKQPSIQTHVSQTPDGLTMTLYLDSLYPTSDLDSAWIEEIQPDSIVLHVQSRRIGYQLQGELLQGLQTPAKSKK